MFPLGLLNEILVEGVFWRGGPRFQSNNEVSRFPFKRNSLAFTCPFISTFVMAFCFDTAKNLPSL